MSLPQAAFLSLLPKKWKNLRSKKTFRLLEGLLRLVKKSLRVSRYAETFRLLEALIRTKNELFDYKPPPGCCRKVCIL